MSDTTSGLMSALMDPGVDALLGASQGFAQAAMPSRLPVPIGAAIGMGAAGALQGARSSQGMQLAQQQITQQQLNNKLLSASMPYRLNLLGGLTGQSASGGTSSGPAVPSPSSSGAPAASGSSVAPYSSAGGALPTAGGIPSNVSLLPTDQLRQLAYYAMASGDDRTAAALVNTIESRAGGRGYEPLTGGGSTYVPGGSQDPSVIARNTAAKAWAGVAPAIAQAAGTEAATAPFKPPVTYSALGSDGQYHDVSVPLPAWAAATGNPSAGGSGGASSGMMPAPLYAARVQQYENATGNPAAPNASGPGGTPTSSAVGNDQFLSNTWLPLYKQTFPQQAAGLSDQQILALRTDPNVSSAMTVAYARQNAPALQQAGFQPTAANLSLAHSFGPQGAISLLQASPSAPVSSVLGPDAVATNPTLRGRTVAGVVGGAVMRYGQAPVDLTGAMTAGAGAPGVVPGAIVGKPTMTPEQTATSGAYGDVSKQIIEAGNKAPVSLERLNILENAAQSFRPGMSGADRLDAARGMVDALQSIGVTPPAWLANGAASGETIGKVGGYLAAEMTRQLGSREAASVFNMIRGIQPNIEMSQGGFQVVVNSLRQGVLRDQDMANFQTRWLADPSHNGSIAGMIPAFNTQYPAEAYASRVIPFPLPKAQSNLVPNTIYKGPNGLGLWTGTGFRPIGPTQ